MQPPAKADAALIRQQLGCSPLFLCAQDRECRAVLVSHIEQLWKSGDLLQGDDAVIANARQFASVSSALSHVSDASAALDTLGADIACTQLEAAMASLGELDGRQVTEDIVDRIFHNFCVGK